MTESRGLVALTGGTGFLGAYIQSALLKAGWRVRLLARREIAPRTGVSIIRGDLSDDVALEQLVNGADVVVHAAGLTKAVHAADFFKVNQAGAEAVAKAVRRQPHAPRVVVVSSLAAREPKLSPYAASKRAGERAFSAFVDAVVLRPTAVYGPGDIEVSRFLKYARGGILPVPRARKAMVTLIHAADVAEAVTAAAGSGVSGIFELTDARPTGYGWRELAQEIVAMVGGRVRIEELPACVFRAIAGVNWGISRFSGRAEMLMPGKVRELFHRDWSSDPARQLPPDLWQAQVALSAGLAETLSWLHTAPVDSL